MKSGYSQEILDWLEKSDLLLLKMSYDKAVKANKKSFSIPLSGFEGSPEYKQHISAFVTSKGLTYKSDGVNYVFHIS